MFRARPTIDREGEPEPVPPKPGKVPVPPPMSEAAETMTAPTRAPSRARTRTRRRSRTHAHWRDELLAQFGLLLFSLGLWGVNALFTVLGLLSLGIPWPIGLIIHVLISRIEMYLWPYWREPIYLLAIIGCIAVDAGTTLLGALPVIKRAAPWLLGDAPVALREWLVLLSAPMPTWWGNAATLAVLAIIVALGAERLVRKFATDLAQTWNVRTV